MIQNIKCVTAQPFEKNKLQIEKYLRNVCVYVYAYVYVYIIDYKQNEISKWRIIR